MDAKKSLQRRAGPSGEAGHDAGILAALKAQGYGIGKGVRDTFARPVPGNSSRSPSRVEAPSIQAAPQRAGAPVAKYGNKKSVAADGTKFDSRAEHRRWAHLRQLQAAGLISDLQCQVAFELVKSVKFHGANRAKPSIRYVADFVYMEKGVEIIEDVKGVLTTEFKLKRHLMKALLGLEVRLVK